MDRGSILNNFPVMWVIEDRHSKFEVSILIIRKDIACQNHKKSQNVSFAQKISATPPFLTGCISKTVRSSGLRFCTFPFGYMGYLQNKSQVKLRWLGVGHLLNWHGMTLKCGEGGPKIIRSALLPFLNGMALRHFEHLPILTSAMVCWVWYRNFSSRIIIIFTSEFRPEYHNATRTCLVSISRNRQIYWGTVKSGIVYFNED